MSKPSNRPRTLGPDGATPVGEMTLTGLVRTSKGFAVATARLAADGSATVTLGPSQTHRPAVASEHQRMLAGLANRA